jgi:hypothetical protein
LPGYSQTTPQPVPASDEGPAVYVVRVISSTQRDAFVACLAENDLPFWRELKEKGLLAKVSVFETTSALSDTENSVRGKQVTRPKPEMPAWNFVISSQLAEGANADSFLQAVEKRKGCENAAGIEVRRVQTLRTTPNCNRARSTPADDLKARESKVEFLIEYIAVKDTPEALDRYRKFMSLYECLGDNTMIRDFNRGDGWWFGAVPLETVKVNYSQPGMPDWNHMDFVGYIPAANLKPGHPGKDPAARKAYVQAAIREQIPAGVASAWEAELAAMRSSIVTYPRTDHARQLFELAVR